MKIVEKIFDIVFSAGTLVGLMILVFGYFIVQVAESEKAAKELRIKQTAYCYNIGQVLVETDAGRHCTAPENLTVIK